MKKKVLSMALVSAMAVSLFGGVTVSAEESEIGGSLIIWEHTDQFTEPLKSVVEGFNELLSGCGRADRSKDIRSVL